MEVLPSSSDKRNLECLLEAFGSVVSLDDIASVYCRSGRDPYIAGQMLFDLQRSTSKASSASTSQEELESFNKSSGDPFDNSIQNAHFDKSKPKKHPASMGTVSGVIGKEYVRNKPSNNQTPKPKPLKLNSDEIPISELWAEKDLPDTIAKSDTMHRETEEFLFQMLGDGFHLEKGVIQDIVGQCGYDMNKSMEKLLDLSASTLEKSDDILKVASEKHPILEHSQCDDLLACTDSSGSSQGTLKTTKVLQLPNKKDKSDIQKEVLEALFTAPERTEKAPRKRCPLVAQRKTRPFGQVVEGPLTETIIDHRPVILRKQVVKNNDEENEDNYDVLRKAVMEYWITMKEYYKAALDAFTKQDYERAHKLLEEGHFFMKKAREADEKSAEKLIERDDEEEMVIDVHDFEPKDALRFLKVQLATLSGISSFKYLKVVVGSNDEKVKKTPRKRLIIKLLERETINWTEEGDGWIIVIPIADIDPKNLSFTKK